MKSNRRTEKMRKSLILAIIQILRLNNVDNSIIAQIEALL